MKISYSAKSAFTSARRGIPDADAARVADVHGDHGIPSVEADRTFTSAFDRHPLHHGNDLFRDEFSR